jgi:signal transduction histidine kinase
LDSSITMRLARSQTLSTLVVALAVFAICGVAAAEDASDLLAAWLRVNVHQDFDKATLPLLFAALGLGWIATWRSRQLARFLATVEERNVGLRAERERLRVIAGNEQEAARLTDLETADSCPGPAHEKLGGWQSVEAESGPAARIDRIRLSEERFRLASRATRQAVYEWDIIGAMWSAKRHDETLEWVESNTPPQWRTWLHPRDRSRVTASFAEALRSGEEVWREEFQLRLRDGTYGHFLNRTLILRSEEGQAVRLIGAIEDATEQRRAEADRYRSEQRAFLGTLGAGLAHELNSPLGTIRMAADRALELEGSTDAELRRECLEDIVSAATRSSAVVQNVFRFARHERTEKWPCPPNLVARAAVNRFLRWVEAPHASLELNLAENLPEICVSPICIEQALINLLRNAAQAGGPSARLRVGTRLADHDLRFEVSHEGPGISGGVRPLPLEPSFTTRDADGVGSGPSFVDAIAADHQGHIEVDSLACGGTRLALSLPIAPVETRR